MIWAKNEFIIFVTLTRLDKRLANDCGGEKQKKWKNIILTNLSMTMTCQWLMVIKLLRTYRKTLAAAAYSILSSIAARVLPYCHD